MNRPRSPNTLAPRIAALALALVCGLGHGAAHAQATEAEIKAAYVYNFGKFIEWPEKQRTPGTPFVVCHTRLAPAFQTALAALEKRVLDGQTVTLKLVNQEETLKACHILVVDDTERNPSRWIDKVASQPILLVGDGENFARDGGALAFVAMEGRIQFAANTDALARSQLKAKAQLLKLATVVKDRR